MAYKNKEDGRKQNIAYLNTESGFMIVKWNDIKKRINKKTQWKKTMEITKILQVHVNVQD